MDGGSSEMGRCQLVSLWEGAVFLSLYAWLEYEWKREIVEKVCLGTLGGEMR